MTSIVLPPVRRSREVAAPPERTWVALTAEIGSWWPLGGRFSCSGPGAVVGFRDGALVETAPDGTEFVWGEVLDWDPPRRLRLTWHPGRPAGPAATEVELSVVPLPGGGSRVEVVHTGWERTSAPDRLRDSYDKGWVDVLAPLGELLG